MFTGIIEEVGTIESVRPGGLTVAAEKALGGLSVGDSVNVNGACLTVTSRGQSSFSVDVVPETLRRTNLGSLGEGEAVNLERAVAVNGRLGGHIVQGHVDGTGAIEELARDGESTLVTVSAPTSMMRYVVEKGFISVDGASLTVVTCSSGRFSFAVIPHTRDNTVLGSRRVGDRVNLEVDIVAKYVERLSIAAREAGDNEGER
jgi:riboflavin synthase